MHNLSDDSFGQQMMRFYDALEPPKLPANVRPLLPFKEDNVRLLMDRFYHQYFSDNDPRVLLFGINPGRLGAGITGIGFTDPIRLQEVCGILHNLDLKPEPSSVFIYNMIDDYGGPELFYRHFHFTSVSPVGYVSNGVNVNYYDTPQLKSATTDFIVDSIKQQIQMPVNRKVAFSVGKGQNLKFLTRLNNKFRFFDRIEVLPHPRWVMQYQFKRQMEHIDFYLKSLSRAIL